MKKTVYEDYKYSMQDTSFLYVGTKYTLGEILDEDEVMFKFRLIVERYVLPEADLGDTLETYFYYLKPDSFQVKIFKQLKTKIKINIIEEKKSIFGKRKKQYVTRLVTVEQLTAIPPKQKEKKGIIVQELRMSKLALMAF